MIPQKEISKAQISYLTSKVRNTLLKTSNPVQGVTQDLTDPAIRKLYNFYKKFKTSLKNKKANREKHSQLLAENIEFIYNLIRGDYTFEDLSETKRTIVLDLKQFFGFKEERQSKKAVNYNVSLFLAIKIYSIIKQNKNTNLNKSVIDEMINGITELVIHNDFRNEFFNILEIYPKRNVASFLKRFQFNISYDWVYRTSFQDHVFKLIYLINQLFRENGYWSNLTGFDKLIAEGLQESSLFQNDYEFSAYFRLNLTIILCRIIHKLMQDSPDFPQDISNHPNLNPSLKQEFLEYLLKEITAQKNINFEFLEKFYKLSLEEFQANYEKFQTKLASDMIYYYNFRTYLSKLIKVVYAITHSVRKKSGLSKVERVIINDLANYNFRWDPERGTKYYFYSNENEPEISENEIKKTEKNDIFTIDIPNDSPLWRVRAYVIGFLLSDGTIYINKKKGEYIITITQNERDKDILENLQKAIGGKIGGPNKKNSYRLRVLSKNLYYEIKRYGMVECHSKEDIAIELLPPDFIQMKINGISLLRDFIRAFFEGDGTFYGSYEEYNMKFNIVGPEKFLKNLVQLIADEIPNLTYYITPQLIKVYVKRDKEYYLFGSHTIYIKGKGFYELKPTDLENGIIKTKDHSWLKILHIAGSLNCIKFFNWLYCNNDNFDSFEIENIGICGRRKFRKSLKAIGDSSFRKKKLAPYWKDVIYDIIPLLKKKYYTVDELMDLTNKLLLERLNEIELKELYEKNRIKNKNVFRWRLKYLEFRDNLIGSYITREGSINKSYYYSKIKPPPFIPQDFKRKVELIENNGKLKKNVKNLIIYIFMLENKWRTFDQIRFELNKSKNFAKSLLRPNTIEIYLLELISFDILIVDDDEKSKEEQKYLLNCSILPKYFNISFEQLKIKNKKKFKRV